MKYNYLLAYLFIFITLIGNVIGCKSTTLTTWKYLGFSPKGIPGGYVEAKLEVKGEGTRNFKGIKDEYFFPINADNYKNMFSKDKKFGIYGSFGKDDLTYTWEGKKSQYLAGPNKGPQVVNGKLKRIYYGCI